MGCGETMKEKHYAIDRDLIRIIENSNISPDEQKRVTIYIDWIEKQLELYTLESQPLSIPQTIFPNEINDFVYNKSSAVIQGIIDKYYINNGKSHIKKPNTLIDQSDLKPLLDNIILLRGNVVWVEFGFNVGCEFGGKHPAIILKAMPDELIVTPLTSGIPTVGRGYEVPIGMVYGLSKRDRYVSITRNRTISKYRVDLSSPIGSIHSRDMNAIMTAIKNDWKL